MVESNKDFEHQALLNAVLDLGQLVFWARDDRSKIGDAEKVQRLLDTIVKEAPKFVKAIDEATKQSSQAV